MKGVCLLLAKSLHNVKKVEVLSVYGGLAGK